MNDSTAHVMIMNSYFDFLYAKALYECLSITVKRECYGCEVDHPSQVQHACVMYDQDEHISMYFEKLLDSVNEDDILFSWSEIVDTMNILPELLALQKFKMYSDEWRASMKTDQWREKMKKMILKIAQLENRLFQVDL